MIRLCGQFNFAGAILLVGAILAVPVLPAAAKEFRIVRTGIYALRTDMLMNAMAKELCSCVNVAGLGADRTITDAIEICLERAQLPITPGLINALTGITVDAQAQNFDVDPTVLGAMASLFQGSAARARYDPAEPQFGCRLVSDSVRPGR